LPPPPTGPATFAEAPADLQALPGPAEVPARTVEKGIAAYGYFAAPMGLGEAARRGVDALRLAGIPVSTHTLDLANIPLKVPYPADDPAAPAYDTALLHINPGGWLDGKVKEVGKVRKIAVWHWELPVFPAPWAAAAALVDEIWAPSRFVADMIAAATTTPIRLVPHPATAVKTDKTSARERLRLPPGRRVILTAFDFGSYAARKNPDAVLRAYRDAFPRPDDAPILMVKYHRANADVDTGHIARIRETPNVVVIDHSVPQEEMRDIHAAADAFVSLHRAEGVGLNILDMMALGKVCIATGYSGNLDFMNSDNSLLIPWTMREVRHGEYPFGHGQWWAEPDHDAAVAAMRFVGRASDEALASIGERAATDTDRDFSLRRVSAIARAAWAGEAAPEVGR